VLPVVGPEEMRALDAASNVGVDELIRRAGAAVARVAVETMGGTYGRRVVVVCGKGNNGADGRVAASVLRARGVRVVELDAVDAEGAVLPPCDLVVDAAYGTGFRGAWTPPVVPDGVPVVAVDVPSGPDSWADVTVTFAALKPSLVFDGPHRAGVVVVEDIGLEGVDGAATSWVVEPFDVRAALPRRPVDAHKYHAAVAVVAGSPGMTGAAALTAAAVHRAGSGYCRLGVPGAEGAVPAGAPIEAVAVPLPAEAWAAAALAACERMRALALGPGLGRSPSVADDVRQVVAEAPVPVVLDADGLFALGESAGALGREDVVLTPHDGEFARLAGAAPPAGVERVEAVRALAGRLGCVVLLKGPVTVVAEPGGEVRLARTGTPALATAGTGDVLTGVLASFLAQGLPPLDAASCAAVAHGAAALSGPSVGPVASDLPPLVARFLS
jgi:ADP-dependent NAD(P)H-hydrate dehydratase / NAD(P)H-hydrate epimerase